MSGRDRTNEELLEEISRLKREVAELEECAAGQKRAEASLRQCQARLKEVQRLSHIAQWQVDLQTGEAFWSDEDYRILGYEPGEVKASWDIMLKHIHPPTTCTSLRRDVKRCWRRGNLSLNIG